MLKRFIGISTLVLLIIIIVIPASLAVMFGDSEGVGRKDTVTVPPPQKVNNQIPVKVYRTDTKQVETLPLEVYVEGVVAAEMPAEFELEALKAQAMVARTYIIRRLAEQDYSDVPKGAHVTDTVKHQVYIDDEQRKQRWGFDYDWKSEKIKHAVVATEGQVITYKGKPINATYFSTSNGFTENSEEYWIHEIPYLRSVEVPWDKNSPKYKQVTVISINQFKHKLGIDLSEPALAGQKDWSQVMSWSTGRRIAKIKVGSKVFTGREVREKLQLPSSHFSWTIKGNKVYITTNGYGHGVGMSQWGANGMAKEGKKADEIIRYFYCNVAIEDYHQWVKVSSKKNNSLKTAYH